METLETTCSAGSNRRRKRKKPRFSQKFDDFPRFEVFPGKEEEMISDSHLLYHFVPHYSNRESAMPVFPSPSRPIGWPTTGAWTSMKPYRLVHHSVILELNLASYRMEAAKKNRGKRAERVGLEQNGSGDARFFSLLASSATISSRSNTGVPEKTAKIRILFQRLCSSGTVNGKNN